MRALTALVAANSLAFVTEDEALAVSGSSAGQGCGWTLGSITGQSLPINWRNVRLPYVNGRPVLVIPDLQNGSGSTWSFTLRHNTDVGETITSLEAKRFYDAFLTHASTLMSKCHWHVSGGPAPTSATTRPPAPSPAANSSQAAQTRQTVTTAQDFFAESLPSRFREETFGRGNEDLTRVTKPHIVGDVCVTWFRVRNSAGRELDWVLPWNRTANLFLADRSSVVTLYFSGGQSAEHYDFLTRGLAEQAAREMQFMIQHCNPSHALNAPANPGQVPAGSAQAPTGRQPTVLGRAYQVTRAMVSQNGEDDYWRYWVHQIVLRGRRGDRFTISWQGTEPLSLDEGDEADDTYAIQYSDNSTIMDLEKTVTITLNRDGDHILDLRQQGVAFAANTSGNSLANFEGRTVRAFLPYTVSVRKIG